VIFGKFGDDLGDDLASLLAHWGGDCRSICRLADG